jgi:hypothetical protein
MFLYRSNDRLLYTQCSAVQALIAATFLSPVVLFNQPSSGLPELQEQPDATPLLPSLQCYLLFSTAFDTPPVMMN